MHVHSRSFSVTREENTCLTLCIATGKKYTKVGDNFFISVDKNCQKLQTIFLLFSLVQTRAVSKTFVCDNFAMFLLLGFIAAYLKDNYWSFSFSGKVINCDSYLTTVEISDSYNNGIFQMDGALLHQSIFLKEID